MDQYFLFPLEITILVVVLLPNMYLIIKVKNLIDNSPRFEPLNLFIGTFYKSSSMLQHTYTPSLNTQKMRHSFHSNNDIQYFH